MEASTFMFLEEEAQDEEAPDERDRARLRQLEAEVATLRRELAAKTVQLSKREQADRAAHEKWAQERAAQLAAAATPDKDARIATLENNVRQLEASLAERAEELESALRLQNHYKQRAKEALAAAAEREADGAAERENSRNAATAVAEEELELLNQELARVRTRAAVEADVARRELAEARGKLAAAAGEREKAVQEAVDAAIKLWERRLEESQQLADEQVAELQDEVVRLRAAAEANQRSTREEQFAAELSSLNKGKIQSQRECEALRDMAAQAAAQHREELARWMQENAQLKARIAADAASAAMGGRVIPPRGGKTFEALQLEGAGGAFESFVASLERRRRGLAPLLAVTAVAVLVMVVALIRAAFSGGGGLCFLEHLGITIGQGCGRPGASGPAAALAAKVEGATGKLTGLLESPLPRHKDVPANLRRLLLGDPGGCLAFGC